VLSTVTALVEAAAERRALTRTLYSLWRDIEECREESHYCSTTAALQAAEQLTTAARDSTTATGGSDTGRVACNEHSSANVLVAIHVRGARKYA
jgi:hypothetical protein